MPKSIILEFTDRSTTPEKVKVVFSDEEWKRLSSFLDEARRLFETPAIKQGLLTMKQEISWKAGVGVTAPMT